MRAPSEPERSPLLGALHSLLVIALPDLCPRASVDVGQRVLHGRAGRHRRRLAVDGKALRNALHDLERIALVELAALVEVLHDTDGLDERLVVVEHDLVLEAQELSARVLARRVDLDRLKLVAELESA